MLLAACRTPAALLALSLSASAAFGAGPSAPGNWAGAYAGAFLGASSAAVATIAPFDADFDHVTAGLLGGYAFQFNRAVLGIEADIGLGGKGDEQSCAISFAPCAAAGLVAKTDFDGHLRAIAGILASDQLLFFAAGGLAVARNGGGGYASAGLAPRIAFADDFTTETMWGYSLGVGAEYRPLPDWSIRGEVLYDAYGTVKANTSSAVSVPCGQGTCSAAVGLADTPFDFDHIVTGRIALIHRFH